MNTKHNRQSNDNDYRFITVEGDLILYKLKSDNITHYLSFDPVLLDLLKLDSLIPEYNSNGRLRLSITHKRVVHRWFIYDVAFACYEGLVHANSFIADLDSFREYKHDNGMTIDHLMDDDECCNHTRWNLSLMDMRMNQSKSNIMRRFTFPYVVFAAVCDGCYRLELFRSLSKEDNRSFGFKGCSQYRIPLICESAEALVENIQRFSRSSMNGLDAPRNSSGKWYNDDKHTYRAGSIKYMIHRQWLIANIARDEFLGNVFYPLLPIEALDDEEYEKAENSQ